MWLPEEEAKICVAILLVSCLSVGTNITLGCHHDFGRRLKLSVDELVVSQRERERELIDFCLNLISRTSNPTHTPEFAHFWAAPQLRNETSWIVELWNRIGIALRDGCH